MCKCQAKDKNGNSICDLETFGNSDKCILHCNKSDWYEIDKDGNIDWIKSKNKRILFWNEINKYILKQNGQYESSGEIIKEVESESNSRILFYEFNSVIFPSSRDDYNDLDEKEFFLLSKELDLFFKGCQFHSSIDLSFINKSKAIEFDDCCFYDDLIFNGITFDNSFLFQNSKVHKDILLNNISFKNIVSFCGSKFFGKCKFVHCRFNELSFISDIEINKLELQHCFFQKNVSFLNIKVNELNRETARTIKDSFEQKNNIIEANRFYSFEMKEYDKELTWKDNFKEKLVFKLHEWSSDHSQNWTLPLFWILFLSMTYSAIEYIFIDKNVLKESFIGLSISFLSFPFILSNLIENLNIKKYFLSFIFLVIGIYFFITTDYLLEIPAKAINPFSFMRNDEEINGIQLIFKVIIAYLIYQFIISIRQNTRRK